MPPRSIAHAFIDSEFNTEFNTESSSPLTTDSANQRTDAAAAVVIVVPPPPPLYSLTATSSSFNEGETATFTLITTNVPDGTVLAYSISGVSAADVSGGQLSGKVSVVGGKGSIGVPLLADKLTEGNEVMTVQIEGTAASASVRVIDTSLTPPVASYKLSAQSASVNEGEAAVFTLFTANVPDGTVLAYSVSGVSAADVSGGQLSGKVIVFKETASISIPLLADNLTEGNEALTLSIIGTPANASVKVIDTSLTPVQPTYSLTAPASVNEGETATFTLITTNVPDGTVLPYSISGVSGADVGGGLLSGKVSVIGNKAAISVSLLNDNLTEGNEAMVLSIIGTPASTSVKVIDTSLTPTTAPATYSLTAPPSVNEGQSAVFTLLTTNLPDGAMLGYSIAGVSAADISGGQLAGQVTVKGNQASISVPLLNDGLTEGDESLVLSINGTSASASIKVLDTSQTAPVVTYTMAGTQGNDYFVLAANNQYLGGAGNDIYLINPYTLNHQLTASIIDTEGANTIQLTDGTIVGASMFLGNAVQLTLSTGAVLQVLGASSFSFQIGANAIAGDGASALSFAQLASALGASLPTSGSATGTPNFVVPSGYTATQPTAPTVASASTNVGGSMGDDYVVVAAGDTYFGGSGNDTYLVGGATFAGNVTAVILDVEGSNTIQLVDGTTIASSLFLNDAVQLTLSTGARLQLPGASKFSIQVGANITAGDTAAPSSFAQFGSLLGVAIPAVGGAAISGTANYLVPTSSGGGGGGFIGRGDENSALTAKMLFASPLSAGIGSDLDNTRADNITLTGVIDTT